MSRALLITGGGGVGKTTLSAALGVSAARAGHRTLVVTVDPARRLAAALGIRNLGSEPTPTEAQGGLWAAMLDASSSWDAIVHRHAPPDVAERLVANEFFTTVSHQFPASQAYAAAEEMANYLDAKAWDLVIVDTPPSSGGIGFFTAPTDMRDLVGGRLLRWLTGSRLPGRNLVFNMTGKPALRVAGTVLGTDLLERVADFFMDLRTTYDGLSRRAKQIERHFQAAASIVVTTADPAPVREAERFFRELPAVAPTPSVVLFNRMLPLHWTAPAHLAAAEGMSNADAAALERNLERWAADALRQAEVRSAFAERFAAPIATVGWQHTAPADFDALAGLIETSEGFDLASLL
jgi:anion-transporting  ArsA/GET3 family ATPase